MRRTAALLYGVFSYLVFFLTFLYSIGFLANAVVPRTVDRGPEVSTPITLLVNTGLLGGFAVQHSLMARDFFKEWWTQFVPEEVERSTYVLFSSLFLIVLFYFWKPMTGTVWSVESPPVRFLCWTIYGGGWLLALLSTFMIDHFGLFGLSQVYRYFRDEDRKPLSFQTPYLYRYVRHPIMLGFLIAFWATPDMSTGHLLFAVATTGYILIGIHFEERTLVERFGDTYRSYREQVPMLIPLPGRSYRETESAGAAREN